MTNSNYIDLINKVLSLSKNKDWDNAVNEWEIVDCEEDENMDSSCICGKEHIKYLFKIKNTINNNILYPIGSSCIKKFDRTDLTEFISTKESMFKLLHKIEDNKYISLTSEFFTRKLLKALFDENAFKPTKYNNFNGEDDYDFLLKMFNKRDKSSISEKQNKKIKAIILSSIKPHLQEKLKIKNINGYK